MSRARKRFNNVLMSYATKANVIVIKKMHFLKFRRAHPYHCFYENTHRSMPEFSYQYGILNLNQLLLLLGVQVALHWQLRNSKFERPIHVHTDPGTRAGRLYPRIPRLLVLSCSPNPHSPDKIIHPSR
eukprot:2516632-Rhodomonas_salina.1